MGDGNSCSAYDFTKSDFVIGPTMGVLYVKVVSDNNVGSLYAICDDTIPLANCIMTDSGKGDTVAGDSRVGGIGRAKIFCSIVMGGYISHFDISSPAMILAAWTPVVPCVFPIQRSMTNPVHNCTTFPVSRCIVIVTASGGARMVIPVGAKITLFRNRNSPRIVPVQRHVHRMVTIFWF